MLVDVDPRLLRLPSSRSGGADPIKLARQIAKYGKSLAGMPPLIGIRGKDDEMQIIDGVTRATRVARLLPGVLVTVEVIDDRPKLSLTRFPTVGDKLP